MQIKLLLEQHLGGEQMQAQGIYTLERTIELPNTVARIFRPELTEEEKNKRMQRIKTASANLIKGAKK